MKKDQYKYFRIEARELLGEMNRAILELERHGTTQEVVARLLRFAHTLKGASRVVKQTTIAELAHAVEDAFAAYRDGRTAIPQEVTNRGLGFLDTIDGKVASLESTGSQPQEVSTRASVEEGLETVRVELQEMDALLESISEASVQLTSLRRDLGPLDRARQLAGNLSEQLRVQVGEHNGHSSVGAKVRATADELRTQLDRLGPNLARGVDQVEGEFVQVSDASNRLRLLPAATLFPQLERAVRDAAQSLQKQVTFEALGGEKRLDAHVVGGIRDALLHAVRNAVAHGIERPPERLAAKKPAQGRVELRVQQRGTRVAFVCRDDGRGVDVEAVRRVAVRRGLATASEIGFGLEEAIQTILKGGVTTNDTVDEVSGRGIGLDVVRETADRLKGQVNIRSETGLGMSLEIVVPVSISSVTTLVAEVGGVAVGFPLASIRQTMRLANDEIAHSAEKDSIVYDGKAIPFLSLGIALRQKSQEVRRRFWSVIVVEAVSDLAAVGVDRLLGTGNVVVRPLPPSAVAERIVAGASLNPEGDPQLVLDPEGTVAVARGVRAPRPDAGVTRRPSVLVIDDSLTTRMLEQSILESAGYEVEIATSGEEGLEKARTKQYGLFLVDVEMPGMDGFEFVSRTRADARLSAIPSILVTSRSAVEDRQRGEEVGARAYIVKGEFDQGYLLRMTRELVG